MLAEARSQIRYVRSYCYGGRASAMPYAACAHGAMGSAVSLRRCIIIHISFHYIAAGQHAYLSRHEYFHFIMMGSKRHVFSQEDEANINRYIMLGYYVFDFKVKRVTLMSHGLYKYTSLHLQLFTISSFRHYLMR